MIFHWQHIKGFNCPSRTRKTLGTLNGKPSNFLGVSFFWGGLQHFWSIPTSLFESPEFYIKGLYFHDFFSHKKHRPVVLISGVAGICFHDFQEILHLIGLRLRRGAGAALGVGTSMASRSRTLMSTVTSTVAPRTKNLPKFLLPSFRAGISQLKTIIYSQFPRFFLWISSAFPIDTFIFLLKFPLVFPAQHHHCLGNFHAIFHLFRYFPMIFPGFPSGIPENFGRKMSMSWCWWSCQWLRFGRPREVRRRSRPSPGMGRCDLSIYLSNLSI